MSKPSLVKGDIVKVIDWGETYCEWKRVRGEERITNTSSSNNIGRVIAVHWSSNACHFKGIGDYIVHILLLKERVHLEISARGVEKVSKVIKELYGWK